MRTTVAAARNTARPLRAVTLLVAASLLAGACGEQGKPEPVANPRDPVRVMLRERADALNAKNLDGWLAPVTPEARPFEEAMGRGALSVPLARVDLHLGRADVDQAGTRFEGASVVMVFRYRDLPSDNVFRFYLRSDIELRDGRWAVTRSTLVRRPGIPPPPMWWKGPVEVATSPHFLALHAPGVPRVGEALALAETARERLLPRLTLEPDGRHLVNLAADQRQYVELTGSADSVGTASFALRAPSGSALQRPENREMYVDVGALVDGRAGRVQHDGGTGATAVEVFQHELGHLALSRFTRMGTPPWVREAGAMHLAGERRMDGWKAIVEQDLLARESLSLRSLSGRSDQVGEAGMESGGMAEDEGLVPLEYAYANAAASYLIETFGIERFWDFYQNFKAIGGTPEVRASGAQRLVRRYYGFDLEELDVRTRDWIRSTVAAGG